MTELPIQGGCACGNIQYTVSAEPGFSFHCQCRSCQHMSGTGHASALVCKEGDTEITGDLKWYERKAPSGNIVGTGFCGTCGSPILNKNSGYAGNLFITAGSLDDPSRFKPTKIVYRDEGHPWDFADPEAQSTN